MSGHSKWATIKRQKGANDAKKGKIFTKLSKAITIAVKQGGGEISSNPHLRLAVDTAKTHNMPKDNIDRAIKKALGKDEKDLEELIYEGFGPGGFSLIIEVITDNKQRTTPEIKNRLEKLGGSLGTAGSVAYQFTQRGLIIVKSENITSDEMFLIAADCGAEDIELNANEYYVYTKRDDLAKVRDNLLSKNIIVISAEFVRIPLTTITLDDTDAAQKALNFIEDMEDMDDIQKVYFNFEITDEAEKRIASKEQS